MATSQCELNVSDLKDIIEALKQGYFPNDRWSPLGLQLGLLQPTLSSIRTKYRDDPQTCLQECLSLWLSKADIVANNGRPTLDSLASALKKIGQIFTAEKIMNFKTCSKPFFILEVLSTPVCQMLRKQYDRLSPLTLPVKIVQMLYTEKVISKETLDEVNRLGGVLGDGPLKALCTTVYEDPNKLKIFTTILLKSEQTVPVAKDILKEYYETFPHQVNLQCTYQYDFDQMRVAFGNLIHTLAPLIEAGIPSLKELKTYLRRCFRELRPQLSSAESFDDVMQVVEDKCTIINICCLEAIVKQYNITDAKTHITEFKTTIDTFCEKVKISVCCKESFKRISSSHHLTCETVEFVLEWKTDEHTLNDIRDLLSKAFENLVNCVQVRAINEGNSVIVTCYAPNYMMDILLMTAVENLVVLKEMGLIKLTISYDTIYNKRERDKDIIAIVEDNIKDLRSHLEVQQIISKKMTMQITSVVQQSEETRQRKEKAKKELESLLKWKEVTEKEPLSVSAKRQKQLETLQEIITSLTLRLRDRDKQRNKLKQNLRDLAFISKASKPVTDQGLDNIQIQLCQERSTPSINDTTEYPVSEDVFKDSDDLKESDDKESGDTGHVVWSRYNNSVRLTRASVTECEDIVRTLTKEQNTVKEWSISLWYSSSPESTAIIINNLNKCTVKSLYIRHTPLDSKCVSILSEILKTNKTIKTLVLYISSLTGGIKEVSEALFTNTTIEQLAFWSVVLTDEDIIYLSNLLTLSKTLKELHVSSCNVTDNGVRYICEGLNKNQTLTKLNIGGNDQITSVSTSAIAELIETTTSMIELRLYHTSLNDEDIKTICKSLTKNTTIQTLYLSRRHEDICKNLDSYQIIINRLKFW